MSIKMRPAVSREFTFTLTEADDNAVEHQLGFLTTITLKVDDTDQAWTQYDAKGLEYAYVTGKKISLSCAGKYILGDPTCTGLEKLMFGGVVDQNNCNLKMTGPGLGGKAGASLEVPVGIKFTGTQLTNGADDLTVIAFDLNVQGAVTYTPAEV